MIAEKLLSRLEKVKERRGNSWLACCPAHDDKNPSLVVTEENERVLVKCWSGCSPYEICESVGLDITDLFPERPKHRSKPLPIKQRFNAHLVLQALSQDALVCEMVLTNLADGEDFNESMIKHMRDSARRLQTARELCQ